MRLSETTTAKYNRQERIYMAMLVVAIIIVSLAVNYIFQTI
jgi:hypothetical protein